MEAAQAAALATALAIAAVVGCSGRALRVDQQPLSLVQHLPDPGSELSLVGRHLLGGLDARQHRLQDDSGIAGPRSQAPQRDDGALSHLELPTVLPSPAPARAPPWSEDELDQGELDLADDNDPAWIDDAELEYDDAVG